MAGRKRTVLASIAGASAPATRKETEMTTISAAIELNRTHDFIDFWLLRARDAREGGVTHSPEMASLAARCEKLAEDVSFTNWNFGSGVKRPEVKIRTTDPAVLEALPIMPEWLVELIGHWPSGLINHKLNGVSGATRSVTNAILRALQDEREAEPKRSWGTPSLWQDFRYAWCAYLIGDPKHGMLAFARSEKQREAFAALGAAWKFGNSRQIGYWQSVCHGMTTGLVPDVPDHESDLWEPLFHNGGKMHQRLQGMLKAAASGDIVRIQNEVLGMRYIERPVYDMGRHPFHELELQQKFCAILDSVRHSFT
jgi:hypothetical protein